MSASLLINRDCYYSDDQTFFSNLGLESTTIANDLEPIMAIICNRIESTYKSPAHISFLGAKSCTKKSLLHMMQFDDVCIKLLHLESQLDIFVVISARLARTLLIRLLATSLIDDSSGLLFSATEKGIFSFIVARLLFDLKNSLFKKMPDLKLIGIFHTQNEAIKEIRLKSFGVYQFSLSFAAEYYPTMMFVPRAISKTIKKSSFKRNTLMKRCGHITRPMIVNLKTLKVKPNLIDRLAFSDLIIFDHATQKIINRVLTGPIDLCWQDALIRAELNVEESGYRSIIKSTPQLMQDGKIKMEEIEPLEAKAPLSKKNQDDENHIKKLTKSICVSLSIELSRVPMSLKEIAELKSGEIIDLHRKIEDPLRMVVEEKTIGYCEAVQIEGRLGIRILSLEEDEMS